MKDCTKEELIFVIERLQFYSLSGDYYVQRALGDVEEEREARKLRTDTQILLIAMTTMPSSKNGA